MIHIRANSIAKNIANPMGVGIASIDVQGITSRNWAGLRASLQYRKCMGRVVIWSLFTAIITMVIVGSVNYQRTNALHNLRLQNSLTIKNIGDGNIAGAQLIAINAYRLAQSKVGNDYVETAFAAYNLGYVEFQQENYAEALGYFQQAYPLILQLRGAQNLDTIDALHYLARTYEKLGKTELALDYYTKLYGITMVMPLVDDPYIFGELENFKQVADSVSIYDNAYSIVLRDYQLMETQFGKNHPNTARAYTNLAEVYTSQGNYDLALPLFIRAKEIYTDTYGDNNINSLNSINALANFYMLQHNYFSALVLYKQALTINGNLYDAQSHQVSIALTNLADVQNMLNFKLDAQRNYQKALEISEGLFGATHPEVLLLHDTIKSLQ